MVNFCAIKGCINSRQNVSTVVNVSFFRIPAEVNLCREWKKSCALKENDEVTLPSYDWLSMCQILNIEFEKYIS